MMQTYGMATEVAMATTEDTRAIRHLEAARDHLRTLGDVEAVESLDAIISRLSATGTAHQAAPEPPTVSEELVSAREAAEILGVSSVSPVWTWVGQGKLAWRKANGVHWITRESVEKLIDDPVVQAEREDEAEAARIWAPFEPTDEDMAEIYDWWPGTER